MRSGGFVLATISSMQQSGVVIPVATLVAHPDGHVLQNDKAVALTTTSSVRGRVVFLAAGDPLNLINLLFR